MGKFVFSRSILMEDNSFILVEFIVIPHIKGEVEDEFLSQLEVDFTKAIKDYVKTRHHTVYAPWEDEDRNTNQRLVLITKSHDLP